MTTNTLSPSGAPSSKAFQLNVVLIIGLGLLLLGIEALTLFKELSITLIWVVGIFYVLIGPVNGLQRILNRVSVSRGFTRMMDGLVRRWPKLHNLGRISIFPSGQHISRLISIVVVMGIFIIFVATVVGLSARALNHRLADLKEDLPSAYAQITQTIQQFSTKDLVNIPLDHWLDNTKNILSSRVFSPPHAKLASPVQGQQLHHALLAQVSQFMQQNAAVSFKYFCTFATQSLQTVVFSLTGLVLLFYFLMDGRTLTQHTISVLPQALQKPTEKILNVTHNLCVTRFAYHLSVSGTITLVALVLNILFHLKYPALLALWLGVSLLLPVLGLWIGVIPTAVVLFTTHELVGLTLLAAGLMTFYSLRKWWLLKQPVPLLTLHPTLIVVSLFIGLRLFGLSGLLLTIPLAAMITAILNWPKLKTKVS